MRTIEDLRESLFTAMEGLKAGTLKIDDARAISELGQVIINTAKVEVEFLRATDGTASGFFQKEKPAIASQPATTSQPRLVRGSAQSGSK